MREAEWIAAPSAQTASAPVWHPGEGRLYWGDAAAGRLYRYDPAAGKAETVLDDGRPVGAVVLQADGSLLLFRDQANVVVFRDCAVASTVVNSIVDYRHTRFAAAAADPSGRVVCSVYSDSRHTGRLLLLDCGGRLSLVEDGFCVPAGLAFSADGASLFFSDAHETRLSTWRYAYDAAAARPLAAGRSLFHACFDDAWPGAPAGLAAAGDGSLWVARRDGSLLVRHGPDGAPAEAVRVPVRKPAALCFGGEALSDLYVTTSGAHRKAMEGPRAGDLAVVRGVSGGVAPFVSKVSLPDGGGKASQDARRERPGARGGGAASPEAAPPPPRPEGGGFVSL